MIPQRANDLCSPPLVGERHLVRCIRTRSAWLPVVGLPHQDGVVTDIGPHVHYDARFLDLRSHLVVSIAGLPPERVALVIAHRVRLRVPQHAGPAPHAYEWSDLDETTMWVEMECLREMPAFPHGHESAPWVSPLEDYVGCRRAVSGVCPHAGTDGRSFPRTADGSWTCLHGLRIGADGVVLPYAESSRRSQNAISDCGLTDNTRAASDSIA